MSHHYLHNPPLNHTCNFLQKLATQVQNVLQENLRSSLRLEREHITELQWKNFGELSKPARLLLWQQIL